MRVCVIGGGLFGSVIARHLRWKGAEVCVVDEQHNTRGSNPAACLIKPSWISSIPRGDIDDSLEMLDYHYGYENLKFKVWPSRLFADVAWVNPRNILVPPEHIGRLIRVVSDGKQFICQIMEDGKLLSYCCDKVIFAAGVWSFDLYTQMFGQDKPVFSTMQAIAGCARLYPGQTDEPFIRPWAPYKQLVAFNRDPNHIWVGDGAAILHKNWGKSHEDRNKERCDGAVPGVQAVKREFGLRPYVKGHKPCYLTEEIPGVWIATGGAKNGTIAAAWAALQIGKVI